MLTLQQSGAASQSTHHQFPLPKPAKAAIRPRPPLWRQERLTLCGRARMPAYLRPLANTLCFEADEAGLVAWTVADLTAHQHLIGHRWLSKRTVQYHLRMLEAIGFLKRVEGSLGRGHRRRYRIHPARLDELGVHRRHPRRDPAWPKAAAPVKGATKRCNEKVQRAPRSIKNTLLTYKHRAPPTRAPAPGSWPIREREWDTAKRAYELGGGCRHEAPCGDWKTCVTQLVMARRPVV